MGNAYAHFEQGTTVEASTGRLNNSDIDGATGVQVRLLDKIVHLLWWVLATKVMS